MRSVHDHRRATYARLHEARRALLDLHEQLDPNTREADEVARLVTELRRGLGKLHENAPAPPAFRSPDH